MRSDTVVRSKPRWRFMFSRFALLFAFGLVVVIRLLVTPANSQTPSSTEETWSPPSLPEGITLSSVFTQTPVRCRFIGTTCVKVEVQGPSRLASVSTVLSTIMSQQTTQSETRSSQSLMARAQASPIQVLLSQCRNVEDRVETLLKANSSERLYKNSDIINEAASRCSPDRVSLWRIAYPDN